MSELSYRTASGALLVVSETTIEHLRAHPTVWSVLGEALARLELPPSGLQVGAEIDLGRPLESATCVPAPALGLDDATTFAKRAHREHPSRVVEGPSTTMDTTVTIRAHRMDETSPWQLGTAYIGKLAPAEPWQKFLATQADFDRSFAFWSTHALIFDAAFMASTFVGTWRAILRDASSPYVTA